MGKIFLRIYGGTIAVIIVVTAILLSLLALINGWRKHEYQKDLAEGTLWLISQGAQKYTEEFKPYWLEYVGSKVDTSIELADCNNFDFSFLEQREFANGEPVIRLDKNSQAGNVIYPVQSNPIENSSIENSLAQKDCIFSSFPSIFSPDIAQITSELIIEELNATKLEHLKEKLEQITENLHYPVNIIAVNEALPYLDSREVKRLNNQETVTRISNSQNNSNEVWFYRINERDNTLLEIGPVKLFNDFPHLFTIIAIIVGIITVTSLAFLLVRPLRKSLKQLEDTALGISQGNLSSKVILKKNSPIYDLGVVFNGMTEHISRLIHAQQDMIRAVSHELRTPIARLRFGLETLVVENDMDKREQKVDLLDNDIEQLNELVDEIITFMRLEQGAPKMEYEVLDIGSMLKEIRSELIPIAENSNNQLRVKRIAADTLTEAEIHPLYWKRAIQNLATNAIKYGRNQTYLSYRYNREQDTCEVWVEDNGAGVPVSERDKIFDPFTRLDSSRTSQPSGGYGLGLSIVKRISNWHGGTISVDMSPDLQGARFIFSWPRKQPKHHVLGDQSAQN